MNAVCGRSQKKLTEKASDSWKIESGEIACADEFIRETIEVEFGGIGLGGLEELGGG
jgi:hypothetical protein